MPRSRTGSRCVFIICRRRLLRPAPLTTLLPSQAGSARVFDHEIPGGQYANLLVQCKSMGIYDKWGEVLDMYRDVNTLFGNVVKVTPSSKCVGDLALYLVTRSLSTADVLDPVKGASIEYVEKALVLLLLVLLLLYYTATTHTANQPTPPPLSGTRTPSWASWRAASGSPTAASPRRSFGRS